MADDFDFWGNPLTVKGELIRQREAQERAAAEARRQAEASAHEQLMLQYEHQEKIARIASDAAEDAAASRRLVEEREQVIRQRERALTTPAEKAFDEALYDIPLSIQREWVLSAKDLRAMYLGKAVKDGALPGPALAFIRNQLGAVMPDKNIVRITTADATRAGAERQKANAEAEWRATDKAREAQRPRLEALYRNAYPTAHPKEVQQFAYSHWNSPNPDVARARLAWLTSKSPDGFHSLVDRELVSTHNNRDPFSDSATEVPTVRADESEFRALVNEWLIAVGDHAAETTVENVAAWMAKPAEARPAALMIVLRSQTSRVARERAESAAAEAAAARQADAARAAETRAARLMHGDMLLSRASFVAVGWWALRTLLNGGFFSMLFGALVVLFFGVLAWSLYVAHRDADSAHRAAVLSWTRSRDLWMRDSFTIVSGANLLYNIISAVGGILGAVGRWFS